ncbi:TPA: hypothetical protein U1W18_000365 [Streptococcus suis]|nr:hypothetical protein [Streptococcus suis]
MKGKISVSYHSEQCRVRINKEWRHAEFLGIFQDTGTDLFGQPYARPVAAVRFRGRLVKVEIENIDFCEVENEQAAT